MNAKEKEIVTPEFCALPSNYNLCPGGQGGFGYINLSVDVTARNRKIAAARDYKNETYRQKLSDALINKPHGRKPHDNFVNSFLGKSHSEATKKKLSDRMKITSSGERNSQYGTIWINDGVKNTKINKNNTLPDGWFKGRVINKKR